MLVLFNVVPLVIYFVLLACLAERFGTTDWGRMFVMAAATFGTFLTTFAVVINNHLPAAVCAAAAVYAAVRIVFDGQRRLRYFVLAGLFARAGGGQRIAGLGAAWRCLALVLLWKARGRRCCGFLPAVLVVAAAFFGTNWIAHGSLKPAYLHHSGNDNWYDYTYERNGRKVAKLLEESAGHRPGRARREASTPCTSWSAITASFRSRRSGC